MEIRFWKWWGTTQESVGRKDVPVALASTTEDELKRGQDLLKIELDGSTSINGRGASLAALAAVILGFLGAVAPRWVSKDLGEIHGVDVKLVAAGLLCLAGVALLVTIHQALRAARPRVRQDWELWEQYRADIKVAVGTGDGPPRSDCVPLLFMAVRDRLVGQAERNNAKARNIRFAYRALEIGLFLTAFQMGAVVLGLSDVPDRHKQHPCVMNHASAQRQTCTRASSRNVSEASPIPT